MGRAYFFQIRSLDTYYVFGQHVVKVHCAAAGLLLLEEEEFSLVRVVFYSARVH